MSKLFSVLVSLLVLVLPVQAAENISKVSAKDNQASVLGWIGETREGDFEVGIDADEKHNATKSGYIQYNSIKFGSFDNMTDRPIAINSNFED